MLDKTDEELVSMVQSGDILAFESLVKRYQRRLVSFAYHIVYNEHLAEEAVQDAFFSLYRTIDRVDTSKKFSSYLFGITKNAAISQLRKRLLRVPLNEQIVSEDVSFYEQLISKEETARVKNALAKLEHNYRTIIELYYFDDVSYEQISKTLHIPLNTVRTHLRRGKEKLKKLLSYETS